MGEFLKSLKLKAILIGIAACILIGLYSYSGGWPR